MSLQQWVQNGWLKPHKTSAQEIENLIAIVNRDMEDASKDISADWRFGIAYNAALKLATILLAAEGYRPERMLQHYRTIQAIPLIMGEEYREAADFLDPCRLKRNTAEYEYAGAITNEDVQTLVDFVKEFSAAVMKWLSDQHPELISG